MSEYTPLDWYWLADDGRVYASARSAVVDKSDKDYAAREAMDGHTVTRWPVDEAGAQTVASMQDVVRVYGLAVPGVPREAPGSALVHVLDKATKVCPRDLAYVGGLSAAREDMASIIRIATVLGTTPTAWFDMALGGDVMTSVVVPVSLSGNALTGGFVRYKGDDWDGSNILLFQYGTLVKGTTNPDGSVNPDTVTPINITGFQPVGSLIVKARQCAYAVRQTPTPQGYSLFTLTLAADTARIVDAPNGYFGFCPRSDITSQIPCQPDDATMAEATIQIAAKLIDTATPGNLGTIAKAPILVYQA